MYSSNKIISFKIDDDKILLINTITGRKDVVRDELYRHFKRPNDKRFIEDRSYRQAVRFLLKNRYIFKNKKGERDFIKKICKRHLRFVSVPQIIIVPNQFCNFKCTYCNELEKYRKINRPISGKQIDHIFLTIFNLQKYLYGKTLKKSELDIYGGEPLLLINKLAIEMILKRCRKHNISYTIFSNGYYLYEFSDLLSKYADRINHVQVTIDGTGEVHDRRRMTVGGKGTFRKITRGIDRAINENIPIVLRVNVDNKNRNISQLVRFFRRKKWHKKVVSIYPQPVNNHSGTCSDRPVFKRHLDFLKLVWPYTTFANKKNGVFDLPNSLFIRNLCKYALKDSYVPPQILQCNNEQFAFAPDGYIYPCEAVCGEKKLAIGRYFPELKLFPKRSPLWSKRTRSIAEIERCIKCPIAMLCGGGCPLSAFKRFGSKWKASCDIKPGEISGILKLLEPQFMETYRDNHV